MSFLSLFLSCVVAVMDEPKATADAPYREDCSVGRQVQNRVHLIVVAELAIGERKEKLNGQALLEFGERVLEVANDQIARKVVRHYSDARAKFVIGKSEDARQLRPGLRIVVGERESAALDLWSVGGQFTSDERELLEEIIDVSQLPGVLPAKPVKVGETWEMPPDALLALFGFDHFISSDVRCTLEAETAEKATIKIAGNVQGLAVAAEVKSKVDAVVTFDRKNHLVDSAVWKQTDERSGSPINPAGVFEATIEIQRSIGNSPALADDRIDAAKLVANPASKLILFEDAQKRFRFYHDRDWYITVNRPETAVLRRMKGGDFVAQLNVTALGDRSSLARLTKEEFQRAVEQAGGWKVDQIVKTDELPTDGAFDLQCLTATGENNGVKLAQRHYLATNKQGRQICFSFVLDPANEEKLGTIDLSLVSTVEFLDAAAAEKPAPTRR